MLKLEFWYEAILTKWQRALTQDTVPHALLVSGAPGLYKWQLVKLLIQHLYCDSKTACGTCPACLWVEQDNHPDCLWLKPEAPGKAIKIDEVREATSWLQLSPLKSQYKVLVVQNAEALNLASSNALLKTLEEPPKTSLIIMTTEHPERLLATVRSRCQKWLCDLPKVPEIQKWLKEQSITADFTGLPGLGPYALQFELGPEQNAKRQKTMQTFEQVLQKQQHFMFAAEALKSEMPQEVLRYFDYFVYAHVKKGVNVAAWLKLDVAANAIKRSLQDNANLNWQLQLELLLKSLGSGLTY